MTGAPLKIVLATRNAGKVRELAEPLAAYGLEVLGLDHFADVPEVEETGATFADNARLKAEAVARATGLTAIADDSGLCVDALRGAPGVHSARYWQTGDFVPEISAADLAILHQDTRNVHKLLYALRDVPTVRRGAYFCCTMCAVHPPVNGEDVQLVLAEGRWEGLIAEAPRGNGGFGYDPVFWDQELGLSAAEMAREVKMGRSHRAKALAQLLALWPDFWLKRGEMGTF